MNQSRRAVSAFRRKASISDQQRNEQNKKIDNQIKTVLNKCVVNKQTYLTDNAVKVLQKEKKIRQRFFPYILNPYTFTPSAKEKQLISKTPKKTPDNIFRLTQNEELLQISIANKSKRNQRSRQTKRKGISNNAFDHIHNSRVKGLTQLILQSMEMPEAQLIEFMNQEYQNYSDAINKSSTITQRNNSKFDPNT